MKTHYLKCWPQYFRAVMFGKKKFEVRKDDRGFKVGDKVVLDWFNPITGKYSSKSNWKPSLTFKISYILKGPAFGIQAGYCVLQLEDEN